MKAYVVLMTSTDNEWNEIIPSFSFSFFSTPSSFLPPSLITSLLNRIITIVRYNWLYFAIFCFRPHPVLWRMLKLALNHSGNSCLLYDYVRHNEICEWNESEMKKSLFLLKKSHKYEHAICMSIWWFCWCKENEKMNNKNINIIL